MHAADYHKQVFRYLTFQLEGDVFHRSFFFLHECFHLLLQSGVFVDVLGDGSFQVGSVVKQRLQVGDGILYGIEHLFHLCSGDGFDASNPGCYRTFRQNLHHTDFSGCRYVCTAAELDRRTKLNHAHFVAVFFAEEGDGS